MDGIGTLSLLVTRSDKITTEHPSFIASSVSLKTFSKVFSRLPLSSVAGNTTSTTLDLNGFSSKALSLDSS